MIEVTVGEPVSIEVSVKRKQEVLVIEDGKPVTLIYTESRYFGESAEPKGKEQYTVSIDLVEFAQQPFYAELIEYISGKISGEPSHI